MTVGRTITDLSDSENLRDCTGELRRAQDFCKPHDLASSKLASWAHKWGDAIIAELENPSRQTDTETVAVAEATRLEENANERADLIREQLDAIEEITRKIEGLLS